MGWHAAGDREVCAIGKIMHKNAQILYKMHVPEILCKMTNQKWLTVWQKCATIDLPKEKEILP